MPYYRAPAERPAKPRDFTSREVEDMAAGGQTEIVHVDDMVITDAARETAHDLGIRIVRPEAKPPATQMAVNLLCRLRMRKLQRWHQRPSWYLYPQLRPRPNTRCLPRAHGPPRLSSDPLVQAIVQAVRATKG